MTGTETDKGIVPKAFKHIFGFIEGEHSENQKFLVRCSYLEIYMEAILDLLGNNHTTKLDVKEDPDKGVFVKGLTNRIVNSAEEINQVMEDGFD